MTDARYQKIFRHQIAGAGGGWRIYLVDITSTLHGYSARVTEVTAAGREPVTIPMGVAPRNDVPPAEFHRMRRHLRGELNGTILTALRAGLVERIADQPRVPGIEAFDCYIRVNRDMLEIMQPPFAEAVEDDMTDWRGATKADPDTREEA